jgi:hypothetical protein
MHRHPRHLAACNNGFLSGSFLLLELQLRMAREESATLHFMAARLQCFLFVNSRCQIGQVIFFRDLDRHVFAVIFNYGED